MITEASSLAVVNCTCRVAAGKCEQPLETCIQINKAADYALKRGTGRRLSKEEALNLLEECEKAGLVHCSDNRAGMGNVICNCCGDCCQFMSMVIKYGHRIVDPSRYQAFVEPADCQGCEACLERCVFKAILMDHDTAKVIKDKCMGCGLCTTTCPNQAIRLKEIRAADFIPSPQITAKGI